HVLVFNLTVIDTSIISSVHTTPPIFTLFPYTTLFRSKRLEYMTPVEQRIANFMLENPNKVINMPVKEIARHSSTSDAAIVRFARSEEHTSELQSRFDLVCRLLLEKKNKMITSVGF